MKTLFAYLAAPRSWIAIAIIAAGCWLSARYSQHHAGDNVFINLYMHLVPSPLVADPHHEGSHALLEVPLPSWLAAFD